MLASSCPPTMDLLPAWRQRQATSGGRSSSTRRTSSPSFISTGSPGRRSSARKGYSTDAVRASVGAGFGVSHKICPSTRRTSPPTTSPMRSFGPLRSAPIGISRPASRESWRTSPTSRLPRSWLQWDMFSRQPSIPAWTMASNVAGSEEAGPRVAWIFVARVEVPPSGGGLWGSQPCCMALMRLSSSITIS